MTAPIVPDGHLGTGSALVHLDNVTDALILRGHNNVTAIIIIMYLEGIVQLGHVGLVVLIMVDLHGGGIDVGLQGIKAVRKVGEAEHFDQRAR